MAALAALPSAGLCVRCQASSTSTRELYNLSQTTTTTTSAVPEGTPSMNIMTGAVNALFSFKPFFKFASGQARKMIMERGTEIGHPWAPELARLREHDWDAELKAVQNPDIEYPEYYLKPFHAYDNGNLSWDAALEVELADKSVHANVFDPERKVMDPNGDVKLRDSYHAKLCQMLNFTPRAVVDIGCASGLSTFGLHQIFPGAHVIGVDLSPYFISVANFRAKKKVAPSGSNFTILRLSCFGNTYIISNRDGRYHLVALEHYRHMVIDKEQKLPVHFLHAAGEYTGLPSGAFDLVSMCLVCHELPRSATKEIIEEGHRLLRPGGALSIMEMNPYSHLVQSMVNNVFAFTAFKATEPYFDDYRTFHIERAIEKRGFMFPSQMESSPRHRTIVAIKK